MSARRWATVSIAAIAPPGARYRASAGNDIFFVEVLQKLRHPIAERAAKENYVETGAVTLGALYCSARLRLSGEQAGSSLGRLVLLQLTFSPPYRCTLVIEHTDGRRGEARTEWDVPSGGATDRQMNCLIELAGVLTRPTAAIIIPSMPANCRLFLAIIMYRTAPPAIPRRRRRFLGRPAAIGSHRGTRNFFCSQ